MACDNASEGRREREVRMDEVEEGEKGREISMDVADSEEISVAR